MKKGRIKEFIIVVFLSILIPSLLLLNSMQSRKYENLNDEISNLEKTQETLVEENKELVTDISLLSSTARIEKIAKEELNMHKANSDDIVRVEMKDIK